ncbi:MAG TPA: hypothetical protein VG889_09295 [Rhizomicrobium sp.]|nr:hypothetical protein [Rhizomicrobium sp.]
MQIDRSEIGALLTGLAGLWAVFSLAYPTGFLSLIPVWFGAGVWLAGVSLQIADAMSSDQDGTTGLSQI